MRRFMRLGEDWWMSPTREMLGSLAIILPTIIALLLALLLPWIAPLGEH